MDERELLEATTKEVLDKLGFANANISIERDEENRLNVQVDVPPEESGMLIGFHGETLASLQLLLSQIIYKKLGEWRTVILNVGDYRQKRQLSLESMALNAAQRVKLTGQAVMLPYLSSSERRLIHLSLSQDPQVETFSQGEGRDRRLVISPKKKQEKEEKPKAEIANQNNV